MMTEAAMGRITAERRSVPLASLAIVGLGFGLRILASRGDLWVDEIWTLDLLAPITSASQIFWDISHDNNHFLNTLWMFIVGFDGSPLAYRMPSIVLGTLSVAVAIRIGSRSSAAGGVLAGLAFAVAFPFVNYGSEARGYAGLVLAMLVAIDAFDGTLILSPGGTSEAGIDRERWVMGWAVGFGTLCHLTMVAGVGVLGLVALSGMLIERPQADLRTIVRRLTRLFLPSLLLLVPALAAVSAGILVHGRMTIGGTSYAPDRFLSGYGGMADATLGLPPTCPPWLALLIASAGLLLAWRAELLPTARRLLAVIGLGLIPTAVAILDPPNTDHPRYFLICGVFLALLLAEAASRIPRIRSGRWLVVFLVLLFTIGQAVLTGQLLRFGRGNVSTLVATIAGKPGSTYAAAFPTAFQLPLDYYAMRLGVVIGRVALPLTCNDTPEWYIHDDPPASNDAPDTLNVGPDSCSTIFVKVMDLKTSSLSGRHWTLFERQRAPHAKERADAGIDGSGAGHLSLSTPLDRVPFR